MDSLKTQLSLTGQKLGQLRAKSVSQANITRSDIATLIQQCSLAVAREKAEKLVSEEVYQDLLLDIELYIDMLQEGCHELEQNLPLRPTLIEAASTVIYATPYIYCKELDACRDSLAQRLGIDFARSAIGNHDRHVSQNVLRKLSTPIPSATQLDDYLQGIANMYGVLWTPPLTPEHTITALSELLDIETQEEVDLLKLRKLCRQGIPDDPEWLRPRIWKLLLGVISPTKKSWKVEMAQQRNTYYDLVRRVLDPYRDSSSERLPADHDILTIYRQLASLPGSLYAFLEDGPESFKPSPLDKDAPDDSKIASASWLDARLSVLQVRSNESHLPPDVCIESDIHSTPSISLTSFESNSSTTSATTSTTLLPARERVFGNAHPHHCSSLLRLLFIHKIINPGSSLSQSASILVPLYSVLVREVDSEDLPHLEADSFWLLEAVVAEFAGLEDDIEKWMSLLSERLRWADYDLYCDLESRGLDPSLPHYSYRWLMPLLSHTLPLRSLIVAWDSLFSLPPRCRGTHPKLNHLVDICTSMLLRAKTHLIRFDTMRYRTQSLWSPSADSLRQSLTTVDRPQEAFAETLSFLQVYDPSRIGGIGRILQSVSDLAERRESEVGHPRWSNLGSHFKSDLWEAFKPQRQLQELRKASDASGSIDGHSVSGSHRQYSFSAQVTDFVWRGITNRSAMDDGPTSPPLSPQSLPRTSHDRKIAPSASQKSSTIQVYVEKLKDSDTVAKLSKMGSNWHARAFLPSWSILSQNTSNSSSESIRGGQDTASIVPSHSSREQETDLSPLVSSPLLLHSPALRQSLDGSAPSSPSASGRLIEKTKNLVSKTRTGSSIPGLKSAPRPLLLNSSTSIISSYNQPQPGSGGSLSTAATDEWGDVMRTKRHNFYRDSQSSISSSDAFGHLPRSAKSDTEANSSRVVALNRRSISPMAPAFRVNRSNPSSRKSSVSSGYNSPSMPNTSPLHRATNSTNEGETSPFSLPSSLKKYKEEQSDSSGSALNELPGYQKAFPAGGDCSADSDDTTSSSPLNLINAPSKMRTKKNVRPPDLQIRNVPRSHTSNSPSNSRLTVEWPADEHENILTPKATSFNPGDFPSHSRPLRRSTKVSAGDLTRPRRSPADSPDDRADKLSSGYRTRKTSEESTDTSRSRRESAGIEGDDEGYDELLSAYESEDGSNSSLR